jgi:DNA excision repair protein ERCC-4
MRPIVSHNCECRDLITFLQPQTLNFACSWQSQGVDLTSDLPISLEDDGLVLLDFGSDTLESDFDSNYGLLKPEETVLIRAYSDDTDDRMLIEIKPKFIVMFEPDIDFVRRVEVSLVLFIIVRKDSFGGLQ